MYESTGYAQESGPKAHTRPIVDFVHENGKCRKLIPALNPPIFERVLVDAVYVLLYKLEYLIAKVICEQVLSSSEK
jgi:hypothetical protein